MCTNHYAIAPTVCIPIQSIRIGFKLHFNSFANVFCNDQNCMMYTQIMHFKVYIKVAMKLKQTQFFVSVTYICVKRIIENKNKIQAFYPLVVRWMEADLIVSLPLFVLNICTDDSFTIRSIPCIQRINRVNFNSSQTHSQCKGCSTRFGLILRQNRMHPS